MTPLTKPVTRDTQFPYRGKNLIMRATAQGVLMKLAGQRWDSAYLAPWEAVYEMACRLQARVDTPQKVAKRVKRGLLSVK